MNTVGRCRRRRTERADARIQTSSNASASSSVFHAWDSIRIFLVMSLEIREPFNYSPCSWHTKCRVSTTNTGASPEGNECVCHFLVRKTIVRPGPLLRKEAKRPRVRFLHGVAGILRQCLLVTTSPLKSMKMATSTRPDVLDDEMEMKIEGDLVVVVPQRSEKHAASQRRPSATLKTRKPANLACLNCRPRKIKVKRA